mmetsp:Transcript_23644/g.42784  ORF Transcript_23644/g.42784 Transcript_23644/m.42784 type:complete len:483 (-) Transcript_23644:208-1656(-)
MSSRSAKQAARDRVVTVVQPSTVSSSAYDILCCVGSKHPDEEALISPEDSELQTQKSESSGCLGDCCKKCCLCSCGSCLCLLVLAIVTLVVLSLIPVSAFPNEVQLLLDPGSGFGSWTNLFLALNGVVTDLHERSSGHCPASGGVQDEISSQCIVDEAKFTAMNINSGKTRLPLVCGINAFDPRRLNKNWCDEAGIVFDNAGGPNSQCGTMIFGTTANLPTNKISGGQNAIVDFTGLYWMNNNTATEFIGEQLLTFGSSQSEPLTAEETSFFQGRDQGLLQWKGITQAVPSFKVELNPTNPDARWSYDDRCISSNGIMRMESFMDANNFMFYFWDNPTIYGEIEMKDWATQQIWTFEPQNSSNGQLPGNEAFRGIYNPQSTTPDSHSYMVLKVVNATGGGVISGTGEDYWTKFLGFLDKYCITSLFSWKNSCQCKRYCGLTQLNEVQGGCANIEWEGGLHWTPSQADAQAEAQQCCQCTECS